MADSKKYNGSTWEHSLRKLTTATDTITTLPAVLYADGNNATVGLVGNMQQTGTPTPNNPIMPQECGERMGNLFDYTAYFGSTFMPYNEFFNYAELQLQPNTTYTLSSSYREYMASTTRITAFIVATSSGIPTTSNGGISNVSPITITTESDGVLKLYKRISGSPKDIIPTEEQFESGNWIMLNTGSTALPYEPYGYKIPISSANTTTPVYLGQVESTRKIKKLVLTGNETWEKRDDCFRLSCPDSSNSVGTIISTHFKYSTAWALVNTASVGACVTTTYYGTSYKFLMVRCDDIATTVADFKTYLQQQYAAGTPVTVWYVLATPTTGIVNEPIRKIGDYADTISGITIPTITGKDTFDVQTTLKPSEVSLAYTGWHDTTVKELDGSQW